MAFLLWHAFIVNFFFTISVEKGSVPDEMLFSFKFPSMLKKSSDTESKENKNSLFEVSC